VKSSACGHEQLQAFVAVPCTLAAGADWAGQAPGNRVHTWHPRACTLAQTRELPWALSLTRSCSDVHCTPQHAGAHAWVPPCSPAEPTAAPRHPATALAPAQRQRDKWELSEAPCLLLTFGNATPPRAALRWGEQTHGDCRSPPPINLLALTKAAR